MEKKEIVSFMHCATCMSGRLAIGWTKEGFAAWCENCDKKVAHYDLKGNKVKSI